MLIPREVFNVLGCAGPENTRYALNCVQFERDPDGKCHASATDGRCLAQVEWTEPETGTTVFDPDKRIRGFKYLLPVEGAKQAVKWRPKSTDLIARKEGGKCVQLEEQTANGQYTLKSPIGPQYTGRGCEGRFPAWRDVIPTYAEDDCVKFTVDPVYMVRVLDTLRCAVTQPDTELVTITVPKPTMDRSTGNTVVRRPILIEAKSHDRSGKAIVMPWAT
jgi:hypothetical protein